MRYFITYGDEGFVSAKKQIVDAAEKTSEFDRIIAYDTCDLSNRLRCSRVYSVPRGGGLWSWKPDVIIKTMLEAKDGDTIVYCDSGCTIQSAKEWKRFWKYLETHDMVAQRIMQRNDHWTRKEVIDFFSDNGKDWLRCYQYLATTIIIKVSSFTRKFIEEWRELMLSYPEFVMDVTENEFPYQQKSFIENRHDQSIYSALVYKYRQIGVTKNKIYTMWEHIEDYDPFCKQAIRATRLRMGEEETKGVKYRKMIKRLVKDWGLKPFYYCPLQGMYGMKY